MDLLIKNANELITLRGKSQRPAKKENMKELNIIRHGSVAVDNGRIVAVENTDKAEQRFTSDDVIDASGKVVMPGFVDPHTHLVFAGAREKEFEQRLQGASYLEILARGGGILKTVKETRKASKENLISTAEKTLDIMLRHGTTTIEAKSGYGLTTGDEIKCLEAAEELDRKHSIDIARTFLGAHAVPPEYRGRTKEYVKIITEEMIPQVSERKMAEFCDVFCEKGVFNVRQSRKILRTGKMYGLKPKVHADEFSSLGGAELAAEVDAISADHLLFASEKGLEAMAEKGVIAVLLPTASFSLTETRYANARRMIQLGIPTALSTDFNPNCWAENAQMTIAFACRGMKLTPAEAITGTTINAAHAIKRAHEVGSLETGKKADIIILNVPNHRFLGYRFGTNLVSKVVKEGKLVVNN